MVYGTLASRAMVGNIFRVRQHAAGYIMGGTLERGYNMGGTGIYGGPSWRYKCGMPSRAGVPQGLLTLLFIPTPPKTCTYLWAAVCVCIGL